MLWLVLIDTNKEVKKLLFTGEDIYARALSCGFLFLRSWPHLIGFALRHV